MILCCDMHVRSGETKCKVWMKTLFVNEQYVSRGQSKSQSDSPQERAGHFDNMVEKELNQYTVLQQVGSNLRDMPMS